MREEFTFTCYTEDSTGIDSDINIVPLDESYNLETWWWKLCLFENKSDEVNLFFDLDIVIQNDITHIKDYIENLILRHEKMEGKLIRLKI